MPELPDVAIFKQYLDSTALHQSIERTRVLEEAVLEDVSAQTLQRRLQGKALTETKRHGKHLFARADDEGWLRLHFGMTGWLDYAQSAPPEHTRVCLEFENGYRLAYVCPRKLGRVGLVDAPDAFIEARDLGPDARALDKKSFLDRLTGRRGMIKSALMDQQLLAGLGNIYADEVLFQAGLHPKAKVPDLTTGDRQALFYAMKNVLDAAIAHRANPEDMPSDQYLLPHRHEGGSCPACGGSLKQTKVAGRTTYFCPDCQTKP